MPNPIRALALLGVLILVPTLPIESQEVAPPEKPSPAADLAAMSWLAGTWSGEMWGGEFVAYYTTPAGGKILSHSRLLKGEAEAFYEFELFETAADTVRLQPFPGGGKANPFTLTSHEPRKAVFENPDKDYPTRIVYHRVADDNLVITLSDPHGASDREEVFDLKRKDTGK